jgi:hypothetical protein
MPQANQAHPPIQISVINESTVLADADVTPPSRRCRSKSPTTSTLSGARTPNSPSSPMARNHPTAVGGLFSLTTPTSDVKLPKNLQWVFLDPGPRAQCAGPFLEPEIARLWPFKKC